MSGPDGFDARLRAELVDAARRRREPRRLRRTVAALAAAAVAAAGVYLTAVPEVASADVEITHEGGRVLVLLTDLHTSAAEVQAAVDREGLDVDVSALPAGPSRIGRFVGEEASGPGVDDVETLQSDGTAFMGFSIPENWDGHLNVYLGRKARGGELYVVFSDAYAQGEPLACSATIGRPLQNALDQLSGFTVTIRSEPGTPPVPLEDALADGLGAADVASAIATSNDDLMVTVDTGPVDAQNPGC